MIGRTLFDALRLVELLVGLCRMRLSGLELAMAIMIALDRGDEVQQIGCSRQGRHKALACLREKRLVCAMKYGLVVGEDLIAGFNASSELFRMPITDKPRPFLKATHPGV